MDPNDWPGERLTVCVTGAGGVIARCVFARCAACSRARCVLAISPQLSRSHLARRLKREGHYVVACDRKRNEHMEENSFCNEFRVADLTAFDNCFSVECNHVFDLASDAGATAAATRNNLLVACNMLEAARLVGVRRFFYASYVPEKLAVEELVAQYGCEFNMECRISRIARNERDPADCVEAILRVAKSARDV